MAESDEEVDVEDISDGEQISNLRDLAEEEQKDNWYDKGMGNQSFLNPSSSPFSSDYCDPNSWLLDTNTVWSLDPCTDDKSRAAIEQMILEEQMYAYRSVSTKLDKTSTGADKRNQSPVGRLPSANVKKNIPKSGKKPSVTHRKPWTAEEQQLFKQGLGLYGRSWTKIASMIDTRTTLQVKNYAKQYFKQKNKNLVKSEMHLTQGIQEQYDEAFVLANVEEVVNDDGISEDEQVDLCTGVSPGTKEKLECESEEEVEVDIDGSDHEDLDRHLIPGQTTSCPEAVYSALVQAAATQENPQDLVEEGSSFTSLEGNHTAVVSEDMSTCPLQLDDSSSVVLDSSLHMNEEETEKPSSPSCVCTETTHFEECKSEQETSSVVGDMGSFKVVDEEGDHLRHDCDESLTPELKFDCDNPENSITVADYNNSSHPPSASNAVVTPSYVTLEVRHGVPNEKSVDDQVNADNVSFDSNDPNTQRAESNNSTVDRDWAPVTRGEVTSSELLQPSDREQLGASADNPNILYKQIIIDRNVIQDVEKEHNTEFFMGRAPKTPERYVKIRNYILNMWEKTKPSFLFKTAVRGGLRNCGDVNSIGRVHAFLEDIGAVNEGCFDRPVPRVRQQGEVTDAKENVHMESWVNSLRPRKKRPRNNDGEWVDFSKPEGMTIQHLSPDEQPTHEGASNDKGSPTAPRKRPSRNKPSYDPFLLVPCRRFPSPSAVPFDVLIQSETLLVMDTHAHMSTTEVIGLLGGNYLHGSRVLKVSKAIPCRSLSTGLQCEMDPVSQTQASEDLEHRGLAVVGWYHSHPTFAPIPSVRDIETQAKFQEWFGKGGAPFIGVIVSPYNYSNLSSQSQIRCLTISDEWESAGQYRLPYQFDYEVYENEADEDDTVEQVRSIADDYKTYPFRVQLNRRFASSTDFDLLDKLLDSLRARVTSNSDDKREDFLNRIKTTISENIKPRPPIQQSEPTV